MEHEEFQNLDEKNKSVLEFKEWFTREWTLITRYLKSRIIWCQEGTQGAHKVTLKPSKQVEVERETKECTQQPENATTWTKNE